MEFLIKIEDGMERNQEMADHFAIDKSNVSRRVTFLIDHGILKERRKSQDRRRMGYELTENGKEVAKAARAYIQAIEAATQE